MGGSSTRSSTMCKKDERLAVVDVYGVDGLRRIAVEVAVCVLVAGDLVCIGVANFLSVIEELQGEFVDELQGLKQQLHTDTVVHMGFQYKKNVSDFVDLLQKPSRLATTSSYVGHAIQPSTSYTRGLAGDFDAVRHAPPSTDSWGYRQAEGIENSQRRFYGNVPNTTSPPELLSAVHTLLTYAHKEFLRRTQRSDIIVNVPTMSPSEVAKQFGAVPSCFVSQLTGPTTRYLSPLSCPHPPRLPTPHHTVSAVAPAKPAVSAFSGSVQQCTTGRSYGNREETHCRRRVFVGTNDCPMPPSSASVKFSGKVVPNMHLNPTWDPPPPPFPPTGSTNSRMLSCQNSPIANVILTSPPLEKLQEKDSNVLIQPPARLFSLSNPLRFLGRRKLPKDKCEEQLQYQTAPQNQLPQNMVTSVLYSSSTAASMLPSHGIPATQLMLQPTPEHHYDQSQQQHQPHEQQSYDVQNIQHHESQLAAISFSKSPQNLSSNAGGLSSPSYATSDLPPPHVFGPYWKAEELPTPPSPSSPPLPPSTYPFHVHSDSFVPINNFPSSAVPDSQQPHYHSKTIFSPFLDIPQNDLTTEGREVLPSPAVTVPCWSWPSGNAVTGGPVIGEVSPLHTAPAFASNQCLASPRSQKPVYFVTTSPQIDNSLGSSPIAPMLEYVHDSWTTKIEDVDDGASDGYYNANADPSCSEEFLDFPISPVISITPPEPVYWVQTEESSSSPLPPPFPVSLPVATLPLANSPMVPSCQTSDQCVEESVYFHHDMNGEIISTGSMVKVENETLKGKTSASVIDTVVSSSSPFGANVNSAEQTYSPKTDVGSSVEAMNSSTEKISQPQKTETAALLHPSASEKSLSPQVPKEAQEGGAKEAGASFDIVKALEASWRVQDME